MSGDAIRRIIPSLGGSEAYSEILYPENKRRTGIFPKKNPA
jgi:hypothetical protein